MKKVINFIFLLLLCPLVMGAYVNNTYFKTADNNNAITQAQADQTLNLSSQTFGLHGPFSVGLQYSELFGPYLSGAFTQSFLENNAFSIGGEAGKKQYRINGTFARALTSHQRVKVTAEHLAQDASYDFASGSTNQWVGQNAYGLTYQYLLTNNLFKDFNVNTFYSRAIDKNLSSVNFVQGSTLYRNLRHIAGGTDKSVSAGVDLLPLPTTLVGAQINYDDVHYQGRYENLNSNNNTGLGATLSLDQLITHHVKFKLLASDRQTGNNYQAELDWLLKTAPGSQLTLALTGDRMIGKSGLSNDTQAGINLDYTFGGSNMGHPATFGDLSTSDSLGDLADWTSTPAVHMDQVLAVKDEATVALGPAPVPQGVQSQGTLGDEYTVIVYAGQPVDLDVSSYFPKNLDASTVQYSAQNLPQALQLKDHELMGEFLKKDLGSYAVTLKETSAQPNNLLKAQDGQFMSVQDNQQVKLNITVKSGDVPYPGPYKPYPDGISYSPGDPVDIKLTGRYDQAVSPLGLFVDPAFATAHLDLSLSGLEGSNLTWSYTKSNDPQIDQGTLEIKGTIPVNAPEHTYNVSISASNWNGSGTGTQDFKIIITSNPYMDPNTQQVTFKQATTPIDMTQYVHGGRSAVQSVSSTAMTQAGLNFNVSGGNTYLQGTPTHVPTFSGQDLTISDVIVKNSDGDSSTPQSMDLQIAGPPVWQDNPDNVTYLAEDTITPIPLTSHFKIPVNSGDINAWDIEVTGQNGFDAKGAQAVLDKVGLSIDAGGDLIGTLKDVSADSPLQVIVTAKNPQGSSIDANGNAKNLTFQMIVSPYINPTITPSTQTLSLNEAKPDPKPATATFVANSGSGTFTNSNLDQQVIIANETDLNKFNLIADREYVSSKEIDVYVYSTGNVTLASDETFNVTGKNTDGKTGTGEFTVHVVPYTNPSIDPNHKSRQYYQDDKFTNTLLFQAYSGSGTFSNVDQVSFDTSDFSSRFGITVNKTLVGNNEIDVYMSSDGAKAAEAKLYSVTVTNSDGKNAPTSDFTMTVLPGIYKDCPATLYLTSDGYVEGSSNGITYGPSTNQPIYKNDKFYFNYAGLNIHNQNYSDKLVCHYYSTQGGPQDPADGNYYLPSQTTFGSQSYFVNYKGSKTCGNLGGPNISVDVCKVANQ